MVTGLLAPSTFWLGYIYFRDRYRPEPVLSLLLAYLGGVLSTVLALLLFGIAERLGAPTDPFVLASRSPVGFLLYAVLVVGVIEEGVKFLAFWLTSRLPAFDEEIDGIVYASAVALGFATAENVVWFHIISGPEVYLRDLASPFVHMLFSAMWGYAYSRARFAGDRSSIWRWTPIGFACAALVHGLYDFLAIDWPRGWRLSPRGGLPANPLPERRRRPDASEPRQGV